MTNQKPLGTDSLQFIKQKVDEKIQETVGEINTALENLISGEGVE